jgi:hypothetical protein
MATPSEAAQWMLDEVTSLGVLYQDDAAAQIEAKFGSEFVPLNESGNPSIRTDVLNAFRKLSGNDVVWERGERLWRKRESFDEPGRLQD